MFPLEADSTSAIRTLNDWNGQEAHGGRIPPEVTPEAAHRLGHGGEAVQCVPDEDLGVVYTELKAKSIQQSALSRQDGLPQGFKNLWVLQALQRLRAIVVPVAEEMCSFSVWSCQLPRVTLRLLQQACV